VQAVALDLQAAKPLQACVRPPRRFNPHGANWYTEPGPVFAVRAQGMEAVMSVMLFWGVGFAALSWLALEIAE
jgi:hypothetical protein